jgi:hypothetical protein
MKKLITLSLLAVLTFSVSCSQTSQAKNTVDIDVQGPIIKFDVKSHDYGTIEQNANGVFDFVFKNEGTEPLILTNVRSSCGCTIPQWPREPIAPGESSQIAVKYDTRRIGAFSKSITVVSNGSEQPVILKINGKVEQPVAAAVAQ